MWPFSNDKTKSRVSETSDDDPRSEETVEVEETRTKEYTEHTGFIKFSDGERERVEFDAMVQDENAIVLKDFVDYEVGSRFLMKGFTQQAFMTIPYTYLKSFKTIDREKKEMEYTVTVEKPISEVEE